MYNKDLIDDVVNFIFFNNGINDKVTLLNIVQKRYNLIKDRSVLYCKFFAIRFCIAESINFSNTVLSLSKLHKYDSIPFMVCLITPYTNYLFLANSTFLKKISHSSQNLRKDNIRGSFNGSDIIREFDGVVNSPQNFEFLFSTHENYSFEENLERLVEATNNIAPTGKRFIPNIKQMNCIRESIQRAISFMESDEYNILNEDLCRRVKDVEMEIAIAALIENVNLRGRIIEYLITSEEGSLREILIKNLHEKKPLPKIFTSDKLGDYKRQFNHYITETDIKTKILFLSSNPKGYNIDKLLSFLANEQSVYLIYVVAIDDGNRIKTCLCSMYNTQILFGTHISKHWAGRNSRGVTQYDGKMLENIVDNFDKKIDVNVASKFLDECLRD